MIDAVIVFALINVLFELVVLSMVPPKLRLRLLGNKGAQSCLHVMIMILVLIVHWGTLIGTMSGFLSFIMSIVTVAAAKLMFGSIQGTRYKRGIIGYKLSELK